MINYIKSEIYRNLRSKGNYIFIASLIGIGVFLNIVLYLFSKSDPTFPFATTKFAFSALYTSLSLVMYLCASAVSLTWGQEYKNNTLKNTVSFGISKNSIYFSKLLISILYILIVGILVSGAFIISAYILLDNSGIEELKLLINSLITAIPIFLISITLTNALYSIIEKEMNVVFSWISIIIIIPFLLNMLGKKIELFKILSSYMPINIIKATFDERNMNLVLGWTTLEGILKSIVVAIIGCTACYLIGLELFKRKEIK